MRKGIRRRLRYLIPKRETEEGDGKKIKKIDEKINKKKGKITVGNSGGGIHHT